MMIYNMTGGVVRNDTGGSGFYHAQRGSGIHIGLDLTLPEGPGQLIFAPITGRFVRVAHPYADDLSYQGGVFRSGDLDVRAFYFLPDESIVGRRVTMGQVIGVAQDVSLRYKEKYPGMKPHLHVQIGKYGETNPLILM